MDVKVTTEMLPSAGRLGGKDREIILKSMTMKEMLDYTREPAQTHLLRVQRDLRMLKKDFPDVGKLFLIDLDALIFIKKVISFSKTEDIVIDEVCPYCKTKQKVNINLTKSLDNCLVPDEALKIKEIILQEKKFKFKIPSIEVYQKCLDKFCYYDKDKYDDNLSERIITLCACLGFLERPNEVRFSIEDAKLDEIAALNQVYNWVCGSRKFHRYVCKRCGKEADIVVSDMSADMFRALYTNLEGSYLNKIVFE